MTAIFERPRDFDRLDIPAPALCKIAIRHPSKAGTRVQPRPMCYFFTGGITFPYDWVCPFPGCDAHCPLGNTKVSNNGDKDAYANMRVSINHHMTQVHPDMKPVKEDRNDENRTVFNTFPLCRDWLPKFVAPVSMTNPNATSWPEFVAEFNRYSYAF